MHPIVNVAVRAARRAGDIILRYHTRVADLEVSRKGRGDFATEVDRAAERAIVSTVREFYPDHGFLGEEGGARPGKNEDEMVWVVDPLDGTANYLREIPHYAVSIGVRRNRRLEHAVIYDPRRNELFTATRGWGAQLDNRRIRVSRHDTLAEAVVALSVPPRLDGGAGAPFSRRGVIRRRTGSAALDLAYVAAGRFDGFWGVGLNAWDLAAGVLLVREAGGLLSAPDGGEDFMERGEIVATNRRLFRDTLRCIQP